MNVHVELFIIHTQWQGFKNANQVFIPRRDYTNYTI